MSVSDHQSRPEGIPGPNDSDPWAPPQESAARDSASQHGSAQHGVDQQSSAKQSAADWPVRQQGADRSPHVHDQPTITALPSAGTGAGAGSVPEPPAAPGAAGPHPYGHSPAPAVPQPPAGDSYGSGYAAYPGYQGYPAVGWAPQVTPSNGMGITAMVLGILAVCLFCLYGVVSVVLGILALIFGILGRKRVQRGEANNGGMALAGVVLGAVGIVLGVVVIGLLVWGVLRVAEEERERDAGQESGYSSSLIVENA
ncbi:DUF4190 domain-containing protein [Streptomyces katsurahamanus]|uniref:DUF4190 domain-containing protein n=1 Tax=Streptomyces katsurahamanus TaxID=2577098 RepID=A0ABW9NWZ6_9ACTN|nr:DUF4190 domain-containing protein [Streptomyces katsurahamanus]MQS37579.1 DUF4190 domain-containing protein [Streptomyces katsurahamanus]